VRVDASPEGGGVALRYELSPIHVVSKIEFGGNFQAPGIDINELRRGLVDRFGTSPPLGRVDQLSLAIGDTLRERGYRHPEISPRVEVDPQSERAALVFSINPGSRTTLGAITIVGTPTMPREEFLKRLGLVAGAPFEPDALNARITSYIDTRRARGYYQARVTPAVSFADNDRVADLTLTVAPGPHVSVVFSGDPLPGATRAAWCRSSAKDRRTRTCSKTRATGSRSFSARRDIGTRQRLTRARRWRGSCSSRLRSTRGRSIA
jgi:outer membrane protein assembly factor BamA